MQNIKTKWDVLKVFQVFFLPSPSFTEKSADLWKDTSNQRVSSDLWLNL